jgi:uncharacterized protein YaeQ
VALQATLHRLKIQLSDVDRGVYEALDLRLARHPSESVRYLLTRAVAYALFFDEGIAFGPGLAEADEPALSIGTLDGRRVCWIDVGSPAAERLHRASKACPRVVVVTGVDPEPIFRDARKTTVHRAAEIEVVAIDPKLLEALEPHLARAMEWELVRTDGTLYVTVAGKVHEGAVTVRPLAER